MPNLPSLPSRLRWTLAPRALHRLRRQVSLAGVLAVFLVAGLPASAQGLQVRATGPEEGATLEDHVEVSWTSPTPIASTSRYTIRRDSTLLGVAASTVSVYRDRGGLPGTSYLYCVAVLLADGTEEAAVCDEGSRVIAPPAGFQATDGTFEEHVLLTWADRSQIEGGYTLSRDAGNALALDGRDDYVQTPGTALLEGSYTIEFWAQRASGGTSDFVVNIESSPQGDPVRKNLEIGFTADDRFSVAFGTDVLSTSAAYTDRGWHHWAIVYDAPDRRRFVYRDGELVANDVVSDDFSAEGQLEFGRRRKGGSADARGHYHGQLDELRQWNRALTRDEVLASKGALLAVDAAGLTNYWPMDVASGVAAPDVVGSSAGTLVNTSATSWQASGVAALHAVTAPDLTSYVDRTAAPGFVSYTYRLAAFEDLDGDGRYTARDFESEERADTGWRGRLSPPGNVVASDGQLLDRVRVTWTDRAAAEDGFNVYRDGTQIGSVAANVTQYDDPTGALEQVYAYCVTSFGAGSESTQACDDGQRGGLATPDSLVASVDTFDDRIVLTWEEESGTGQGFELFREGDLIATLGAEARQYNDLTAAQGEDYGYCIRSFSEADPQARSTSDAACTTSPGRRAIVLDPAGLTATDAAFEDRVELAWTNPSTTAMLFLVYRDSTLIEVLDYSRTTATDFVIPSDTDVNYCVAAATVVSASSQTSQATVAEILYNLGTQDAIRESSGLSGTTAAAKMEVVYGALGLELEGGQVSASAFEAGYQESGQICATGSRSMGAPTGLTATNDEFETHVRVEWEDNSQVETGYRVFRSPDAVTPIATLSRDRTMYEDYQGTPGAPFTYTVEAFDDYGVSTSASDDGRRTLDPPTQFVGTDGTSETEVQLSWRDNSAGELGYRVYRRPVGGTYALIASTGPSEPGYTDVVPAALRATLFEYQVAAFDAYGESLPASSTGRTFIQAPANVNASSVYSNGVVVVWVDRSSVEENYILTRRIVGDRDPTPIDTLGPNVTTYTDTSPLVGTRYQYCVQTQITSNGAPVQTDPVCGIGRRGTDNVAGPGPVDPGDGPVRFTDASLTSTRDNALRFGFDVAADIDGGVLVGIPGADPQGQASLYAADSLGAPGGPTEAFVAGLDVGAMSGHSVAVSNDYAVVGDPALNRDTKGSYAIWQRTVTVTGSGSQTRWDSVIVKLEGANAGTSVDIADSFVIVGDNERGSASRGGALVCDVAADATCGTVARLDAVVAPAAQAAFGQSVAITRVRDGANDSLYAVVGAPGAQEAYVFECDRAATSCNVTGDWTLAQTIASPFSDDDGTFGSAVAIDSALVVIGDPASDGLSVWERSDGAGWNEQQSKRAETPESDYGAALAIRGTTVMVGAPGEAVFDRTNAGAAYVYAWRDGALEDETRYDAGAADDPSTNARFGTSVDVAADGFLVGAPDEKGRRGAVYAIAQDFVQPPNPLTPVDVDLVLPSNVMASDGTTPDRIQIRWSDEAENEDGYVIYRSTDGGAFDRLAEVSADIEFADDFSAAPGESYTYCVASFSLAPYTESDRACDIGWRPPNGTIAGRVFAAGGAGTDDAVVCLSPSLNRGLLLDGAGGYVEAVLDSATVEDPALAFADDFTIEAWIRPESVTGLRPILTRDSSFSFAVNDGDLRFTVVESDGVERPYTAGVSLPAGAWAHVAVVREKDNSVQFYVDGARVATDTSPERLARPKADSTMLWIGRAGDGASFFSGEIDEVRVWSIARTTAEIAGSRRAALTGMEESLEGYWPLDDGARRVVPDITRSANHGTLVAGVYATDQGADLDVCGRTAEDGNFSIARVRYGDTTEFDVIPTRQGRAFTPGFKKITLSTDSPVQNEVFFNDVTAYTVAGVVKYEDVVGGDTLSCPVPNVTIHVDKGDLPSDDNVKTTTGADGRYAVSVDPSSTPADTWFVMTSGPTTTDAPHTFLQSVRELEVRADTFGVDFLDTERSVLTGNYSGGDPNTCGMDIGTAEIRIYTQDGCYDRRLTVDSAQDAGAFSLALPPLEYLVEVTPQGDAPPERAEDIAAFFKELGAVEVDLTGGDAERNLTYRAPLTLEVTGLEPPVSCTSSGLTVSDQNGVLRVLPNVAVFEPFEGKALAIRVTEDYGDGQTCNVNEGTVTVFDGIADRIDADSTLAIEDFDDGEVEYTTFGASPNIFSGARIEGVDRSYQKPITVVAEVEGRPALVETQWALVNGYRERASTFVSAATEEFPLMILHDPPGTSSYAYVEEGSTMCARISNTKMVGGGAGLFADLNLGFIAATGFSLGAHLHVAAGAGITGNGRTIAGRDVTNLGDGPNREICMTTDERWATSSDPGWVGEDLHMGVALNLIFALADVLETDTSPGVCSVELSEELAADLDAADPFETTYVYGKTHIESTLIPQLENLIRLAGDGTLTGTVNEGTANETEETIRLREAVANWRSHLERGEASKSEGLGMKNYSFSGGAELEVSTSVDTTTVTRLETKRVYFDSSNNVGVIFNIGFDSKLGIAFDIRAEWVSEEEDTESTTNTVGYVLADDDTGDYFSVDIGKDRNYGTYVFDTKAGRSSGPCESDTQCRDNAIISVDPVARYNVDPSDAANFQLTLTNGSESDERRRYVIMAPPETNVNNLGISVSGGLLTSPREYVLDPGTSLTVNMDVFASSSALDYERVGVMMYPPGEVDIWGGDPRLPFAQSDTTFFSVFFDPNGAQLLTAQMSEGWNWFSINREGGEVNALLGDVPAAHGDLLRSQNAESRYDSTAGWVGELERLSPGYGYRIRLQNAGLLRVEGEAVEDSAPLKLASGWTWVGYLPSKRMPIDDALASLEGRAISGDAIVGRESFAHYVKGVGWVGTLRQLVPGESYAIHLSAGGELQYPPTPEEATPSAPYVHETTTDGPEWTIDAGQYDASMTVVGEIQLNGTPVPQTAMKVAAFDGDQIRGVGEVHYVEALDRYLTSILLYGDVDESRPLVLSVYDGESDALYEDIATVKFETQARLGHPAEPVVLELANAGQAPELSDLPDVIALHRNYPNPFTDFTVIGYDLPTAARVTMNVYDVLGRRVSTLVDGDQVAGRHRAIFDARSVASGVYFYRLEMDDLVHTGRMVVVR